MTAHAARAVEVVIAPEERDEELPDRLPLTWTPYLPGSLLMMATGDSAGLQSPARSPTRPRSSAPRATR